MFSCWTTTLRYLGLALTYHGIPFVSVDGNRSLNERTSIINRFQTDHNVRIMLLSVGCGSVGYTGPQICSLW